MNWSKDKILRVLDDCCEAFTFPILDNAYVYLAAVRLSAFSSSDDWALVIEVFGFFTQSGFPETAVYTFGSHIRNRKTLNQFVTTEAHAKYIATNRYNDSHYVYPIEEGDWQDPEDLDMVNLHASGIAIRSKVVSLPIVAEYSKYDVKLEDSSRIRVFELCRALGVQYRDDVLATQEERKLMVPDGLHQVLQLEDWHHPNFLAGQRPSDVETFIQLANVLVSGDATHYHPTLPPNTHWVNWPDAGRLQQR